MIRVYDCRSESREIRKITVDTRSLNLNGFLQVVRKNFAIASHELFVLVTTDRTVVDSNKFEELQDGCTLYLLRHSGQALPAATQEDINFVPHYNTLIESGTYEYFAEGQKSLPCSLAELVDNALSATANNRETRTIEIRMLFDKVFGKPAVIVLDNGCGMTSKQLNNWARYRLSKFARENSTFESEKEKYVRPAPIPRSLNSDISFFGVGGKRAVFHIGDSVRMICKPADFPDVHELVLSKEEFKKKEQNKEDVYKGTILNRKPGDSSHVTDDERFLRDVIAEETGKESFTAVVITGVCPEHIDYLKQHFDGWTRELAHIYHYYIHGVDGNDLRSSCKKSDNSEVKIDILVTLREKPPKSPRVKNLREVADDMQSLYINAAASKFEFGAFTSNGGRVDGVVRYHPFLYDRETYPRDPYAALAPVDDDDFENESGSLNQARGKRDIFECYWNGRLIPYTTVSEFDWCSRPVKGATLPEECYFRISGVLFTNDKFLVNASKLKFMDLELKLKSKETIFSPGSNPQPSKRGNIQKEFTQWLQNCHEKCDKQVKFLSYIETITRTDMSTKRLQHPWAAFSSIELDGKIYKTGQVVKSQKTLPILYGSVVRFLLHGTHDCDVYATGGQVEIRREPKALYDKVTKIIPISKIDRTVTDESIMKHIESDIDKLPEKLSVTWPEGNVWPKNAVCPAGSPFGPLKVEILNRNGHPISSRINTGGQKMGIKLSILFKIIHHGLKGDKEVVCLVAPYVAANQGHWFRKIETLTNLGSYTLKLNTVLNEGGSTVYGDKQLPSFELKFTVKEGAAESFTVGALSSTLRVGVPFNIPLQIKDRYKHPTAPPPTLQPVLECSDLELTYESVICNGTTFIIKGVKAKGKVQNYQQSKSYDLKVSLPGLKNDMQTIPVSLLPGSPHSLHVKPDTDPIKVENGNQAAFNVEVHDVAGNITANPKQIVRCQIPGLPLVVADCSSSGAGQLMTKSINVIIKNGEPHMLKAEFDLPSMKHIAPVVINLKVMPSSRISQLKLFCQGEEKLELKNEDRIEWQAGGLLQNLFYKLYDESVADVRITAEIASSIKVNWTPDVNQRSLVGGRLPDVQVPTQAMEEHFYQVSYQDLSSSFTIVPLPDEPARLKATLPQNTLKLGEVFSGHITLELVDQYDNVTRGLTPACVKSMTVEAEGLDASSITFKWQESSSSVAVTGVRFHSGSLGPREICFNYSTYTERVIVKLTAGVPSQLKLVSGPEQPLQILNGHGIPTPFLVQLCDEWGNPSPDQRVVVELRSTIKVSTNVMSQPVDAEGKASFTVNGVKGTKGYYQLEFRGSFNSKPIPGPSVNLTVIPDPNKPAQLQVNYNTSATFCAGGTFPVFSVMVVSDEGSPITTFNPADLSMLLWEGVSSPSTSGITELKCNKPMENENKDRFYFRNKPIPERAGKHTIQFLLRFDQTEVLHGAKMIINVVANQAVKLGPGSQPPTPAVSYSTDISSRVLVENMTLKIMDKFGNSAGHNLNGKVVVSIRCADEQSRSLPLFEGKTSTVQMSLNKGSVHINRLAIMENSPGENGIRYIVVLKAEVPICASSLAPFELPFHFYNDVDNRRKMAELSRKKDELSAAVARNEKTRHTLMELRGALTTQVQNTYNKESALKDELNRINVRITQSLPIQDIENLLKEKTAEVERIDKMPRRVCSISNNFSGPDVIGMVGHLAFISDNDAAAVISWQLGSDMDCVITRTTEAANRIHHDSAGTQQVMAFDSIFVQQGDRSLPHISNGHKLFDPPGHPVYAKDLLIFPHEQQKCKIVFKTLLGNTILMDDLDSATAYRKEVVRNKIYCPTILTRKGHRVDSRGKFGGVQNRAPPIHKLKVLGAPLPRHYYLLKEQIDVLCQYRSAVVKREQAESDLNNHLASLNSPQMNQKEREIEEIKRQLEDIDRQLASATVRQGKRGPENTGEPSGVVTKRPRQTPRDPPLGF
ncbi:structural maintenance of chromosomes flexible hinge domain-containing protein 1 isoform X2 [Kryptolebias marmoratus]|uniref:structural maintenance of chromosomes flexible hinge domain-containing protein 1 isoform X2 n=1 Tax=Kryptolebias marmoratus TaxID=37003 RepID=UPI0007F918E3|nr:structural maintenance of chromosomes flexible hinge domain-containing protein 1 isoform X2 [Kryptolebias marmoratus]